MFGSTLRDHEARYEYAQKWLDIVKLACSPHEDFDFDGRFFQLKEQLASFDLGTRDWKRSARRDG
jgi:alkanesulfonate monooxygenase SsuD/methylene tetrahydromethanopterin reductase-like flavin-dependent oxidoreductase (luciferase family)